MRNWLWLIFISSFHGWRKLAFPKIGNDGRIIKISSDKDQLERARISLLIWSLIMFIVLFAVMAQMISPLFLMFFIIHISGISFFIGHGDQP